MTKPDDRDVVVIGGGLSGLTTGALLARAGKRTLLVEAEAKPGGFARSIDVAGYRFQPAIHLIMGGNRAGPFGPGLVYRVLGLLGVANRCELTAVEPFYTVRFPGLTVEVAGGHDGYLASHTRHFPDEAQGLSDLIGVYSRVQKDLLRWPVHPGLTDWAAAPFRWPRLVRYGNASTAQVTRRFLRDPQARAVHCAPSPSYVGLPPSQASFIVWAAMMSSYIDEGAFHCRGGFQSLADALAEALVHHGGEILLGRVVDEIEVVDGRATGVRLDDGQLIRAEHVVSTIDARHTFGRLIERAELPSKWMRKVDDSPLSISAFGLYLGTDLDLRSLNVALENFVMTNWDLEEEFRAETDGKLGDVTVTIPTLADPTLAPEGCHQVVVMGRAPADGMAEPTEVASHYVKLAEQVVPGLDGHITHACGAEHGPAGPLSLPVHELGPIYGWDTSPGNSGAKRLPQETPIRGLYLAGQWTRPGHGVWTVIGSGVQAARLILGRATRRGLYPIGL